QNVSKSFDGFPAVAQADLRVRDGEIVGIIGPNGAGKSTFFNCLAGDLPPTGGSVVFNGADVTRASPEEHARLGMARTHQVPATFEEMTILDNAMVGAFLRHPRRADARAAALRVLAFTGLGAPARRGDSVTGTLSVTHLEVRYGDLVGVADVSLEVRRGSVVALLGSNGAGKTTTLNAIAGLVSPSAGAIEWSGERIERLGAARI